MVQARAKAWRADQVRRGLLGVVWPQGVWGRGGGGVMGSLKGVESVLQSLPHPWDPAQHPSQVGPNRYCLSK